MRFVNKDSSEAGDKDLLFDFVVLFEEVDFFFIDGHH
jgi:hypothetical protein